MELTTREQILETLTDARTIAVLGAHHQRFRAAFYVPDYLVDVGYRVLPVNPMLAGRELWGQTVVSRLDELTEPVDLVDVFRRPAELPPILEETLAIGARCLWLQLGVIDVDIASAAADAGLDVIMDRCVKIEHARLFGGLNFVGVNTGVITSHRMRTVNN